MAVLYLLMFNICYLPIKHVLNVSKTWNSKEVNDRGSGDISERNHLLGSSQIYLTSIKMYFRGRDLLLPLASRS